MKIPMTKSQIPAWNSFAISLKSKCFFFLVGIWTLGFGISAYADPFLDSVLKDGIGVRPLGMGGAFVALADDSNAMYYNPAGVATCPTQYLRGYMDSNSDTYSVNECYSITTNSSGLAYWNKADKLGNSADVTTVAFSSAGENGIAWGVTYKNIAWNLLSGSSRGFTMDGGLRTKLSSDIYAGVLLQDFIKNEVPVSTSIRLGLAYKPATVKSGAFEIDAEVRDLKAPKGATIYLHYGGEAEITKGLTLRAGWTKDQFSWGATATFPYFVADYAVIINDTDKNVHMLGFRLGDSDSSSAGVSASSTDYPTYYQ